MRCITKPAMSILGAFSVGIRLHMRFVCSENTCMGLMSPFSTRKQLTEDLLIFSMLCQPSCSSFGKRTPVDVVCAITVVIPKSGEISREDCPFCLASYMRLVCTYDRTIGCAIWFAPMITENGPESPRHSCGG